MTTPPQQPTPGSNRGAAIVVTIFAVAILLLLGGLGVSLFFLAQSWAQISPDDPPAAVAVTATAALTAAPRGTPTPDPREEEPAPSAPPALATAQASLPPGVQLPDVAATAQASLPAGVQLPDVAATVQAIQSTAQASLPPGVQLPDIAATVQASMPESAAPPAQESTSPGVTTLFQLSIPGSGPGQLDDPRGVAVGPDGAIYVAGYSDGRVQRFSPQGSFERGWRVEDDRPILALVAGRDGRVYVSQVPGVSVYDGASGELLDVIAPGEGFQDLALLADGSLLGIPWAGTDLVRLDPDGRELGRIVDPLGAVSPGDRPDALAVDRYGTIYLVAAFSSEIFVFDAQGTPLGAIQTPGRGGSPSLAVDTAGRIYLASILDGLLILDREGALIGTIEVPGYPFDFTFDAEGILYAVTNAPSILKLRVAAQ